MNDFRTEHERVFELLPWLVNGRLDTHDYPLVTQHLEQCAQCRVELAAQQRLNAAINQPSKVEFAPQASFNKLWDRIEADEHAGRIQPSFSDTVQHWWTDCKQWCIHYWLPMTAGLQTVVIVALAGMLLLSHMSTNSNAAYRTVTTPSVAVDGTLIRVVFDDATRLGDVKDILNRSQLTVVAGPTAAGVYSLAPANKGRVLDIQETLNCLREDPRVRFVELAQR